MAGIPGLDVYEIYEPEPGRAVSLRPGSTAQRVPNTAVATRPYQPNWTTPAPATPAALPAPGPKTMTPDMTGANAARARAAAARAPSAPAPAAPSAPAGNVVQRAWRGLRAGAQEAGKASVSAGRALARGSLPALAGAGLAMADDALEANRPAAEPFVAPPAQPGDIPIDTSLRAPAATPEPSPLGFGPNNEFTRNLAAAANALPGVSPVMNASARTAATAARAFGGIETGRRTAQALTGAQAAQQVVRGAQAAQGTDPAAAMPALATTGEPPQADYSNEGNNYPTMRTVPPVNPNGTIIRDGNSYSGTGDIKFGADIVNKDGSLRTGGFGVSSLDTSEGLRQDQLELQRNAAARAGQEANQQAQLTAALEAGRTSGYGILDKDYQRERTIRGMDSPKERESMRAQDAAKEVASLREQGETARNVNTNTTLRDNTAADIALRRRGQDLVNDLGYAELDTREKGFRATARTAADKAKIDAFEKERDFQTGRADKEFEQRGQREAQLQKNIESRTMRQGKNGPEVDTNAARRYREGMDRAVGRLGVKGIQDLGPQAVEQLYAASDLLKTVQENANFLPWNPDTLKTIDPLDLTGLKVMPNGDRVITRPGAARGQVIPGRFFQTEEGARLFGGTPTNRYDILSGSM